MEEKAVRAAGAPTEAPVQPGGQEGLPGGGKFDVGFDGRLP